MLLCSIFSTTVSATNLGSGKINTDNGNSISAQDNVVGKKIAVDVLDVNSEYAEATITGISSEYNVVVSRSNIETVSPINGKYSFILNETYAVSIDYEQSGSKHYSYFEFEIDNFGNVAYGKSMNNEATLNSDFSTLNSTRGVETIYESEPNDSYTTADRTSDDCDNYGLVSSTNDKDFWVVSFENSGTANFWLGNIPSGRNYDIAVYDSNLNFIEYSCNTGTSQELITIDVEANTDYYIYLVGNVLFDASNYYWLRVKLYPDDPIIPNNAFGFHITDTSGNPIENARIFIYPQKNSGLLINGVSMPIPQPIETDKYGYAVITSITMMHPKTPSITYTHTISSSLTYGINIVTPTTGTEYAQYSYPTALSPSTVMKTKELASINDYPDYVSPYGTATVTPASYLKCQNWGWRYNGSANLEFHTGLDISHVNGVGNDGVEVKSVSDGSVIHSGFSEQCGYMVKVQSEYEDNKYYYIVYMHLKSSGLVTVNSNVVPGTSRIGYTGGTYTETQDLGPHLHISVSENQSVSKSNAQYFKDPLAFIKSWNLTQN